MWHELFVGVIAVILLSILWWTIQIVKYKGILQFPGPAPLPIIGNYLDFTNVDPNELLPTLLKLLNKYGPICRLWSGCTPYLLVIDPELTQFILRSPKYLSKGDHYRYITPWLGNSMFTATGYEWRWHKKIITLSMNTKFLERYTSIFNTSSDILFEILSTKADGSTFNIAPLITSYTLDVIVESAMGAKLNTQRQPKNEYANAVHFMTELIVKRVFSFWKRFDFLFVFSKDYRHQKEACKYLKGFAMRIIDERRKQLTQLEKDDEYNEKKMTMPLDILMNTIINGRSLSDEQMRDDLSGFIFAGHDTTATALQMLLYVLSNNQEVQNKIVDELREIYGNDKSRPSTMQDTYEMKYTERVIKETLRYYAPVPNVERKLQQDVHYKNTILPKGLNIVFFIHGIHRNPDIYDKPDVFDPDRFLAENSIKPFSFLPFSAGPRNCLGQKFAMIEIKVTIAKLLRNFEFLPANSGSELTLVSDMMSLNGIINVRMKYRNF